MKTSRSTRHASAESFCNPFIRRVNRRRYPAIRWSLPLLCTAVLLASSHPSAATLIAYDAFDCEPGPIGGQQAGFGWSGAWSMSTAGDSKVVTRNLSYSNGDVSINNSASGKALSTPQVSADHALQRSLRRGITSGDIFISILYQTDTPDGINSWFNQLWLWNTTYNANAPSAEMSAKGSIGARRDASPAAVSPAVDTRDDATHLVVMKLEWDGSRYSYLRVYVNPSSTSTPSGSLRSLALTDTSRTDTWNRLGIRLHSSSGNTGSSVFFGELRVGTTWASAVNSRPVGDSPAGQAEACWYRLGEAGALVPSEGSGRGLTRYGEVLASATVPPAANTPLAASTESQTFDGSSGTLTTRAGGLVTTATNNAGLEAWVRSDNATGDRHILHHGNMAGAAAKRGFGLMQLGGNYVGHIAGNAFVTGPPVQPGVWTHLAFLVRHGVSSLYVNGELHAETNTGGLPPYDPPNDALSIGALAAPDGGSSGHFQGQIDEVRVFTLDPAEFFTGNLNYFDPTLPPWAFRFDWSGVPERSPGVQHSKFSLSIPRPNQVNVLRVDLAHPDIRLASTPRAAQYGQTFGGSHIIRTTREDTRSFLARNRSEGRNMVAAINASPWLPYPSSTDSADKLGLLVENGVVVSRQTDSPYISPSLVFYKDWTAAIFNNQSETVDTSRVLTAVSGFAPVLANGATSGTGADDLNPRTGYGLSADGRYLILLTVDGRQGSLSSGMGTREVGEMLRHFGADDGLNMDGGGSTTMALYNPGNNTTSVVNSPSDGSPRAVGNNLGLFYITTPELVTLADWLAWRGVPADRRGPNDDPAGDGFPNLLAYLFNIHPMGGLRPSDVNGRPRYEVATNELGEEFLAITFRVNRHATAIAYGLESSTTLATGSWHTLHGLALENTGADPVTHDTLVRALIPMAAAERLFARIRASAGASN